MKIYDELLNKIEKNKIYLNEPMSKHTTFKIGGKADIYIKIETVEDLKWVLQIVKENNIPLTVIGNGSNILVKDGGIRGITIKLDLKNIEMINKNTIRVESGVLLSKLSNFALSKNLAGLEFAIGIPRKCWRSN